MAIIRQTCLLGIQELYDMEPTQKYDAIIATINLDKIYHAVTKKSRLGAPEELNYAAMIISFAVRYVERISTIRDLIKRLHDDIAFKLNCGFLVSDSVSSEASYSRLVTKLMACDILETEKENVVFQAIDEGFITDDAAATDGTHFEARDQAPPKEEKPKPEPKKRGANRKERVTGGSKNKQKRKQICLYMKRN